MRDPMNDLENLESKEIEKLLATSLLVERAVDGESLTGCAEAALEARGPLLVFVKPEGRGIDKDTLHFLIYLAVNAKGIEHYQALCLLDQSMVDDPEAKEVIQGSPALIGFDPSRGEGDIVDYFVLGNKEEIVEDLSTAVEQVIKHTS